MILSGTQALISGGANYRTARLRATPFISFRNTNLSKGPPVSH